MAALANYIGFINIVVGLKIWTVTMCFFMDEITNMTFAEIKHAE